MIARHCEVSEASEAIRRPSSRASRSEAWRSQKAEIASPDFGRLAMTICQLLRRNNNRIMV